MFDIYEIRRILKDDDICSKSMVFCLLERRASKLPVNSQPKLNVYKTLRHLYDFLDDICNNALRTSNLSCVSTALLSFPKQFQGNR